MVLLIQNICTHASLHAEDLQTEAFTQRSCYNMASFRQKSAYPEKVSTRPCLYTKKLADTESFRQG